MKMKAVIGNALAVKAAADLANGGYRMSVFQIRRVGDMALVAGTNGYVSIALDVPAKFVRWPDGKSLTFSGTSVRTMMRGIGKSMKVVQEVVFDSSADSIAVSVDADGGVIQSRFSIADDSMSRVKSLENRDWKTPLGNDGLSCVGVDPYMMKLACQAMNTLAMPVTYEMVTQGERKPVKFTNARNDVCVLVMPKG